MAANVKAATAKHLEHSVSRYGAVCVWCAAEVPAADARSKSGFSRLVLNTTKDQDRYNLVPVCPDCRRVRKSMPLNQWILRLWKDERAMRTEAIEEAIRLLRTTYPNKERVTLDTAVKALTRGESLLRRTARRRSRRMGGLFARDGEGCIWCSRRASDDEYTYEHMLQRSKGGPCSLENLTAACEECNSARGDVDVADWVETLLERDVPVSEERIVAVLDRMEGSADARVAAYAKRQLAIMLMPSA